MLISSNPEYFAETAVDPPVRGFLHRPPASASDALVLTHGAGSDAQAPLLVALAQTFSQSGVMVLRCELPFRQRRPHGPPPLDSGERDRRGLKHAIDSLQKLVSGRVFLGGHSRCRLDTVFLPAASAAKTKSVADATFAQTAHSCALLPRHARSFRFN